VLQWRWVSPQYVFDSNVADLRRQSPTFNDFGKSGNCLEGNTGIFTMPEHNSHFCACGGWQCDQNHFHRTRCNYVFELSAISQHLSAMDKNMCLRRIIINKADDIIINGRILQDFAEQQNPGIPGSINHDPFLFRAA
jgi:hypothetical protein